MKVKFSQYRPSQWLAPYVQAYYTGDFNLYGENDFVQSVVPNGCIELIVHLTHDHCELVKGNTWGKSPEFTLIGLQTGPYGVRFHKRVRIFGIRFNPEGIFRLFGIPPSLFKATFESSSDTFGGEFGDYCSRLRESPDIGRNIRLTEEYLLKKWEGNTKGHDYVDLACGAIRSHHGMLSLGELINKLPISPRQLQREFKQRLGITVKEYMRLIRLSAVQNHLQLPRSMNLTELSHLIGFADQSHFIREFKQLAGTNPGQFLRERDRFLSLSTYLE